MQEPWVQSLVKVLRSCMLSLLAYVKRCYSTTCWKLNAWYVPKFSIPLTGSSSNNCINDTRCLSNCTCQKSEQSLHNPFTFIQFVLVFIWSLLSISSPLTSLCLPFIWGHLPDSTLTPVNHSSCGSEWCFQNASLMASPFCLGLVHGFPLLLRWQPKSSKTIDACKICPLLIISSPASYLLSLRFCTLS